MGSDMSILLKLTLRDKEYESVDMKLWDFLVTRAMTNPTFGDKLAV
jgi:hypothetical protein